jgi:hypothetical protein
VTSSMDGDRRMADSEVDSLVWAVVGRYGRRGMAENRLLVVQAEARTASGVELPYSSLVASVERLVAAGHLYRHRRLRRWGGVSMLKQTQPGTSPAKGCEEPPVASLFDQWEEGDGRARSVG